MFPIAKLERLPPATALRKTVLILQDLELRVVRTPDGVMEDALHSYIGDLNRFLHRGVLPEEVVRSLPRLTRSDHAVSVRRTLNRVRHLLLVHLGMEPAEWDLLDPDGEGLDASARRVYPLRAYFEEIRSPFNVGSMFRTAEAFGVSRLILSPYSASPRHPRAAKTARGADRTVPWDIAGLEALAAEGPIFALETGGRHIADFPFPEQGTVVVGSEELGVSPEALRLADQSLGRVGIPMAGAKRSLNVAVAFGILMHAWFWRLDMLSESGSGARKET